MASDKDHSIPQEVVEVAQKSVKCLLLLKDISEFLKNNVKGPLLWYSHDMFLAGSHGRD